jgi:hypothetical protein
MIHFRFWHAELDAMPKGGLDALRGLFPGSFRPLVWPARDCQAALFGLAPEALISRQVQSSLYLGSQSKTPMAKCLQMV